jgi:putative Mg2+ transporter-C (MgtC) family protein
VRLEFRGAESVYQRRQAQLTLCYFQAGFSAADCVYREPGGTLDVHPPMEEFMNRFGQPTWLPFSVIVGRLLLAAALGSIVGIEREWRDRPAGLRTHILICLATATIAILTIEITHVDVFAGQEIRIDPIRLVEATTAGVAFLAAGLIFFAKGEVHGLTTGAGMWLAGAIGLAVGLGFWQIALMATVLALIVLGLLQMVRTDTKKP